LFVFDLRNLLKNKENNGVWALTLLILGLQCSLSVSQQYRVMLKFKERGGAANIEFKQDKSV
jgi:hypothetical protein